MGKKLVIDRIEGEYLICEDENKKMVKIRKDKAPREAEEGIVLAFEGDKIIIDYEESKKLKREIEDLMEDMWE